jgi:hypothetical protein
LSLGLFAVGNYGGVKGVIYGGNTNQLVAQIKGSAVITVCTIAAGLLLMFGVKALGILRVSEAGELEGLDIHDHGAPAYHPEYAYMGYSPIPASMEVSGSSMVSSAPPSDIHIPTSDERSRTRCNGAPPGTGAGNRTIRVFGPGSSASELDCVHICVGSQREGSRE